MMICLLSLGRKYALHMVSSEGNVNCIKALLEGGANINLKNKVSIYKMVKFQHY